MFSRSSFRPISKRRFPFWLEQTDVGFSKGIDFLCCVIKLRAGGLCNALASTINGYILRRIVSIDKANAFTKYSTRYS